MSCHENNNGRICEYSTSGTNIDTYKIANELRQCGIHCINISPCGKSISIRVTNPGKKQLYVINKYFNDYEYEYDSSTDSFFDF